MADAKQREDNKLEAKGLEVEALVPVELTIETEEDNQKWSGFLRDVVYPMDAQAEEQYRSIIDKQKEALREAESKLKRAKAPLVRVKSIIRAALGSYHTRREEAQRRIQERIDESARRAGSTALPAPAPIKPAPVEGVSVSKIWKYEVVDASKLPRKYLQPDTAKIGKLVRSMGADAQEIVGAGVRIWQESSVAVRS